MASVKPARKLPRAEQANHRRREIINAAATIIQDQGLNSLKMGEVAAVVGCGRTLVYRYFPTLDDLLIAVMVDWYDQMDTAMSVENQMDDVTDRIETRDYRDADLIVLAWQTICATGRAPLMLRSFMGAGFILADYAEEFQRRYESRWDEAFSSAGLSKVQIQLIKELSNSAIIQLHRQCSEGEIDQLEGQRILTSLMASLLDSLLLHQRSG